MNPVKGEMSGYYKRFFDGERRRKTLWSRIKAGRSFVDDNFRVSPWLFASDPHGTQMANLICAVDPWCDLYVAKVTEGRSGIDPARVERVNPPGALFFGFKKTVQASEIDRFLRKY